MEGFLTPWLDVPWQIPTMMSPNKGDISLIPVALQMLGESQFLLHVSRYV